MPEKDGDEGKSTKSVVNKKQKQMMGEEGYDIARDQGRVRPSKDKKDATTLRKPPSEEMRNTQVVNTGPSAYELIKKKYKGQIMKVEELDLTQVAEAFGGYIVNEKFQSLTSPDPERLAKRILRKAEKVSKKREQEGGKQLAKDLGKKFKVQSDDEAAATQAAKDIGQDELTPDVRRGMKSVAAGKGKAEPQDPSAARSGSKVKGTPKAPTLKPTTRGRKITKRAIEKIGKSEADEISKRIDAKSDPKQDARDDARLAGRQFKKDFKKSGVTGDIGFTAPDRQKKIQKRLDRADKLKTPDPFSVDTSTAASDVAKDFGKKPVAGGLPMDPTRRFTTTDSQGRKITKLYDPSQPRKREPIPKDSGALADRPKILKKFADVSKKIKDFKKQGTRDVSSMNPSEMQRAFGTSSTEGGAGASGSTAGGIRPKGGALVPRGSDIVPRGGDIVKTVDAVPVKQSAFAKAVKKATDFAKDNPAVGYAAYDLGKGIIGKLMKVKGVVPGVRGGTVGRRSARGGGGL